MQVFIISSYYLQTNTNAILLQQYGQHQREQWVYRSVWKRRPLHLCLFRLLYYSINNRRSIVYPSVLRTAFGFRYLKTQETSMTFETSRITQVRLKTKGWPFSSNKDIFVLCYSCLGSWLLANHAWQWIYLTHVHCSSFKREQMNRIIKIMLFFIVIIFSTRSNKLFF